MKRVLISLGMALLLAVALSLGLFASAEVYSGECGRNYYDTLKWSLDTDTGVLTISGNGEMKNGAIVPSAQRKYVKTISFVRKTTGISMGGATSIGMAAFSGCSNLTSVEIIDTVTSIGNSAFEDCTSLTSIEIPNSVTRISDDAFRNCGNLENVYITDLAAWCNIDYGFSNPFTNAINLYLNEELLTNVVIPYEVSEIKDHAFSGFDSVTSVEIPSGVTSIGTYAFSRCSNLTRVEISDSMTSIGNCAFDNCTSLTSITVSENNEYYSSDERGVLFNKDKTTLIQYPEGNTETSYVIPNSVTSIVNVAFYNCTNLADVSMGNNVTSIGNYAFYGCTNLASINIPDSVTSIGYHAFSGCESLTSIELSDNITHIDSATFENCTSLASISLPDELISIDSMAFYNCTSLNSLTIPESVTSISTAFEGCTSLTSITVSENNEYYSSDERGVLFNKDKTTLIQYPVGNTAVSYEFPISVVSVEPCAFENCTILDSVYITDILAWCNIDFEDLANPLCNGADLYINNVLASDIEIPDGITEIKPYTFNGCESLRSIRIPEGVTSLESSAFENCTNLVSIVIPDSVTVLGDRLFYNCKSLKSITIPAAEIGDQFIDNCTSLESITVSEDNEYFSSDERGVLFNKDKTRLIRYPAGNIATTYEIDVDVERIRYRAFNGCVNLESVRIPFRSDIDENAFLDCPNLTIHGYAGSYAQTYALENGIPFEIIPPGDMDNDGITDYTDIMALAEKMIQGDWDYTPAADMNNDGEITLTDLRALIHQLLSAK